MTVSPFHIIIVLVLGVLFFGRNLPGVAKQIGSALMEFRKGLGEWKEEYHRPSGVSSSGVRRSSNAPKEESPERFESLGTKFEPPSSGEGHR